MKKRKNASMLSLHILIFALMSLNVSADERNKGQIVQTADSLVLDIVRKNPELALYEAQIQAAKAQEITAKEWSNPELSTTVGNKHISGGEDGLAWSVSFQQTFDWPGRRNLKRIIANNEVKTAELELSKFRSALSLEAKSAVYDFLGAQERKRAISEVAKRYNDILDVLGKRDTPGVSPLLEKRIIESTNFSLSRKIVEAEIELQTARLKINSLRGQELSENLQMRESRLSLTQPPPLLTLLSAAKENNFDLEVKRSELNQQRLRLDLATNERNPSFAVGPYVSNERPGGQETQIGIGISIPLPLWNRNEGAIAAQSAKRDQASALLRVAELKLEREISESFQIYKLRLADLNNTKGLSIDDFKKAAALADENYRLGAVPVATYLELQKQYLESVETTLAIRREAIRARQNLEQLTGVSFDAPLLVSTSSAGAKND